MILKLCDSRLTIGRFGLMPARKRIPNFMFAHAVILGALVLVPQAALSESADSTQWAKVSELIQNGSVAEGLREAVALAQNDPAAANMSVYLVAARLKDVNKNRQQIDKLGNKLLDVLEEAYLRKGDCRVATNLLEVLEWLRSLGLARAKVNNRDFRRLIMRIENDPGSNARVYILLAGYALREHDDFNWFRRLLDRAEVLASQEQKGEMLIVEIARQRARATVERFGRNSGEISDLQKIILHDKQFGLDSNWALDQLGLSALAEGNIQAAEVYLKLAGEVRPGGMLPASGYAKGLAFELINAGRLDTAISYLEFAWRNESRLTHRTAYGLGLAYLKKGDEQKAAKLFRQYLKLRFKPEEPVVRNLLARLEAGQGKRKTARVRRKVEKK